MIGFAILLTLAYVATVAKHGATDVTAYRKGKEAPSIEKFRTRHREKADKKLKTPSKSGGKEPGPVRQWARAVTDNAAAELIERHDTKSRARRKWYSENSPHREEQWRQRWQAKLDKREQQLEKFKHRRGYSTPQTVQGETASPEEQQVPSPAETNPEQQLSVEQQHAVHSWKRASQNGEKFQISTDMWHSLPVGVRAELLDEVHQAGLTPTTVTTDGDAVLTVQHDTEAAALLRSQGKSVPDAAPKPATTSPPTAAASTSPAATTSTPHTSTESTGGTVYEQGAQELRESAEEIEQFCQDMNSFADALSGRGFGTEITGVAGEVSQKLSPAGDIYGDLAEQIQAQGDDVRDAHDSTNHQIPDEAAMA